MIKNIYIIILLVCFSLNFDHLNGQNLERIIGNKSFELSNHLGNVLEVTTDRKVQQNTEAEIVAFNDYYPYGMLMDGRHGQKDTSNYRYAFQGQEKDDGIKGVGNSYNYTYRMHDSRLGRFFAVDPLSNEYPYNSVYAFSENRVIDGNEIEGLEVSINNQGTWVMENKLQVLNRSDLATLRYVFGKFNVYESGGSGGESKTKSQREVYRNKNFSETEQKNRSHIVPCNDCPKFYQKIDPSYRVNYRIDNHWEMLDLFPIEIDDNAGVRASIDEYAEYADYAIEVRNTSGVPETFNLNDNDGNIISSFNVNSDESGIYRFTRADLASIKTKNADGSSTYSFTINTVSQNGFEAKVFKK